MCTPYSQDPWKLAVCAAAGKYFIAEVISIIFSLVLSCVWFVLPRYEEGTGSNTVRKWLEWCAVFSGGDRITRCFPSQ